MSGQFEQLLVARDENGSVATGRQFQEFLIVLVAAAGQRRRLLACGFAHDDEAAIGPHQLILRFPIKRKFGVSGNAFKFGEAIRVAEATSAAFGNGLLKAICPCVVKMQHVHDDIGVQDNPDCCGRWLW